MCECSYKYVSWDSNNEYFYCTKCGVEVKSDSNVE